MHTKVKIALTLFILGFIGVLSMLTVDISLKQVPQEVLAQFTPLQLKLLSLINPILMLIVAVAVGVNLYKQVNLSVPFIETYFAKQPQQVAVGSAVKAALIGGLLAGILFILVGTLYADRLPREFKELGESIALTPLARFLYGGFTEEIIMRFGLMTFVTWAVYKLSGRRDQVTYGAGIIISALLFAAAHLPIAFQSVANPSAGLISYIIVGNTVGSLIFGWLYWKRGLEAAFIAHMVAHLVMLLAEATRLV